MTRIVFHPIKVTTEQEASPEQIQVQEPKVSMLKSLYTFDYLRGLGRKAKKKNESHQIGETKEADGKQYTLRETTPDKPRWHKQDALEIAINQRVSKELKLTKEKPILSEESTVTEPIQTNGESDATTDSNKSVSDNENREDDSDKKETIASRDEEIYGNLGWRATTLSTIKALAIARDIDEHKCAEIIGLEAKSPLDIAVITQIYRDPRYETLRIIFTKDDNVVGHTGYSIKLPGKSNIIASGENTLEEATHRINTLAKQFEANGIWFVHNHPSGDPTPSPSDINTTSDLLAFIPMMKGHVIINSNKYASIDIGDVDGGQERQYKTIDYNFGDDKLLKPSIPHNILGMEIRTAKEIATIDKMFNTSNDYATLVCCDTKRKIRAIVEVPENVMLEKDNAEKEILRIARITGSVNIVLGGLSLTSDNYKPNLEHLASLMKKGYLLDIITREGKSLGVAPERTGNFGIEDGGAHNFPVEENLTDEEYQYNELAASLIDKEENSNIVTMKLSELIEEHTHLVNVLRTGTRKSRKEEADKQEKELQKYISEED